VLSSICGPKRDEVIEGWRKLHNEKLHNLYSSPSIIRMIKSRKMRQAHVGRTGMHIGFWWKSPKEDLHAYGRILRWISQWDGMDWISLAQAREQWMALGDMLMNLRVL
jgi:hypothetical protein